MVLLYQCPLQKFLFANCFKGLEYSDILDDHFGEGGKVGEVEVSNGFLTTAFLALRHGIDIGRGPMRIMMMMMWRGMLLYLDWPNLAFLGFPLAQVPAP
jgi:hypothetical protein